MATLQEFSKFIGLTSLLQQKQTRVAGLLSRLHSAEEDDGNKRSISDKFFSLLRQIDAERDHEFEIMSEIQAMESRHRDHLVNGKLERADPNYIPADGPEPRNAGDGHGRLWKLMFGWLPDHGQHISH